MQLDRPNRKPFNLVPLSVSCALFALFACNRANDTAEDASPATGSLTFAVMGDVPYGLSQAEVDKEKVILRRQIERLNSNSEIAFLSHVGDIKKGAMPCDAKTYSDVAEILKTSVHPVFIIPGDNEWNDCPNPPEAWAHWERSFLRFDENWPSAFEVDRQPARDENYSFLLDDVLFVGLNLVGGKVHDWEEWNTRIEDDRTWLRDQFQRHSKSAKAAVIFAHANPGALEDGEFSFTKHAFRPLIEYLDTTTQTDFPKPILLIHGDGHKWIEDHPFPNAGQRITRIQVTQGGLESPLQVEVRTNGEQTFTLIRSK